MLRQNASSGREQVAAELALGCAGSEPGQRPLEYPCGDVLGIRTVAHPRVGEAEHRHHVLSVHPFPVLDRQHSSGYDLEQLTRIGFTHHPIFTRRSYAPHTAGSRTTPPDASSSQRRSSAVAEVRSTVSAETSGCC